MATTGRVDGACKTIVAARAKQAGLRWTVTGLDPVSPLRTLTRSGRHDLIWPNNAAQTPPAQAP